MALFKRKKEGDLTSASPEELDKMILGAETDVSVMEKERDRKKKKFDELFKEGSLASGSRRESIAQELEFIEKDISDVDRRMRKYRKALNIMKETRRAKSTNIDTVDKITEQTSGSELKQVLASGRVKEKFQENKMNQLLDSISDVDSLDEEEESSSKYLKMFEDMDRNREKLVPGEATEEKNKSTNVDENSGENPE
ncbi:MAG: hypothetical protein M1414_04820 [Candidatus Thermoplasmatota archaeon]|jgi:hypothetical protein|nr:hypothetical protein [Candidatus Thermoplasmatota archaeon]MCL5988210.1 hypothetical protein [Candidatus Thermoplasmatota archaeon]